MIKAFQDDLYWIPLPVDRPGLDDFIGAWVYLGGPVAVVDVGPAATTPRLMSALAELGVKRPDVILLTHIHLDHAGGIGAVARAFPRTPVVCHSHAVQHLIDPMKLWVGSQKTLGPLAAAYGKMEPVAVEQVQSSDDFRMDGILVQNSPGHASHHASYLINGLLWAGEAGGVCLPLAGDRYYLRPATPPRFFLETSLASIDDLLASKPDKICYGHVGMRPDAMQMLIAHRRQLAHWNEMLTALGQKGLEDGEATTSRWLAYLLANDPHLAGFTILSTEVQARERYFLMNSVRGFQQYLAAV
jgi:glyoxylase-like metal-dependent hydrolase (beta-lactamase superfamily II)